MVNWITKRFAGKEKKEASDIDIIADLEPDEPYPFGYKTVWYAIENETSESVIAKFDFDIVCESSWKFGIEHAYRSDDVFVSPNTGGFILVVGIVDVSHETVFLMRKM